MPATKANIWAIKTNNKIFEKKFQIENRETT
jgi:hypothetical protein